MNKHLFLTVIALLIGVQVVNSQTTIKTIASFKEKSNYKFSQEWQYLSTDLYLLNAGKFSDLLNDVAKSNSGKKKRRKLTDASIQSLFIKAKLKDLKFFGGEVVYPIYNFKASETKDNFVVETGNIEVVRLIDNLPLTSSTDVIDAEISGEAITKKNSNDFLKLIATQMQNISSLSKPNTAIFDLIGELGSYIESKTKNKLYKFSSTIRLYEGQEFDKRLHSVNVFVFAPSNLSRVNIVANKLKYYLDTASLPKINQAKLSKMIMYKKYPMVVVANYKSRYNSQLVIGDQISFDYLNERKLKIQNAYENELINKTTYKQELKLIEFLEVFAELKLNISNYKLNVKNHITNDFSGNHFLILKIYRDLLKTKKLRMVEFFNNSEFKNEFLPKYESVITNAGLYLNEQNSLTNIKEVAELMENDNGKNKKWDAELAENKLRLLYSIKIPNNEKTGEQSNELKQLIYKTEQELYNKRYRPLISNVKKLSTNEDGLKEKEKIENQSGDTYCKKCKTELAKALEAYSKRYRDNEKNQLVLKNEKIKQNTINTLFKVLGKKKCIEQALTSDTIDVAAIIDLVTLELEQLNTVIDETRELLKKDTKSYSMLQLREQNALLEKDILRLENGFANLCGNLPNKCNCKKE